MVERATRMWGERIEAEAWLARDRALPGVARLLGALRAGGYRLIVLTARRRPRGAELSLRAAGLATLVDEVVVVDPAHAAQAKAEAMRDRRVALMAGDTESDAAAAAAAGVPFRAVSTGQRSAGYLLRAGWPAHRSLRAALADSLPPLTRETTDGPRAPGRRRAPAR